ncbi:MAG TPA: glycosyltransferase family 39 protein [Candidatus Binatia bacterium]|nr:glycosyltransferase family 39 protein [Candidatus Binatia bacterium]
MDEGPPPDPATPVSTPGPPQPFRLQPIDRPSLLVAVAPFVLLMALSPLYGFDRDELYFLDCARHLQLSYVDQPILVPLLAWVSLHLFGVSVTGLRLWSALAAAGTVMVAAMLARELGGGSLAQRLSAITVAASPVFLGVDHIFGPTAFDVLAWSGIAWVVVRLGRTADSRLWVVAGLVLGIAEENKHSVLFLAVAIVLGTLLSGGWRLFLTPWFAAGVALTGLLAVPDLWWQATHGWATIQMTQQLNAENGGLGNIPGFVILQLILVLPVMIWMWVRGLLWLWGSPRPLWRALAWAYGFLFVFFALTAGAKAYYLAGAYSYLVAAGATATELRQGARLRVGRLTAIGAVVFVVTVPVALPVLPPTHIGLVTAINSTEAESIGWPELIHTVAGVWNSLPAAQRADAVIFTSNYGEAGAINELGGSLGLPGAVSGHNTEWWWGPGNPDATTVVAVARGGIGDYAAYLRTFFGSVRVAATLSNADSVKNQENGGSVYICTDPRLPWGQIWPELRQYS